MTDPRLNPHVIANGHILDAKRPLVALEDHLQENNTYGLTAMYRAELLDVAYRALTLYRRTTDLEQLHRALR